MLLSPMTKDEVGWNRTIERAGRRWWTILFSGILCVAAGVIILSINWTLADLAVFLGAFLIFRGFVQVFNAPLSGSGWAYYPAGGLLSVAAGVFVVAWPGPTLLITAIFIGVAIVVFGTMNVAGAISNRRWASYWWVVLVLGVIEIILGLWLLRRPGLTLAVAITATGFWALFVGVMQIVVSFEIRHLPGRLSRQTEHGASSTHP
jgi:uncharacterized membrane protein HdeD (DUF308 family)